MTRGPAISVVPANEASWEDLKAVFGTRGPASNCQCQRFKTRATDWDSAWAIPAGKRAKRLREQTDCGQPEAHPTSGLVAYLDSEPLVWAGRAEDKADDGVWAVTCFVTRAGFPRRGRSRALARAAVDFAHKRGARAVEGYPMITMPGQEITWGELHVGSRSIFAAAGFAEVSRPSLRRVVMRRDF